MSAKTIERKQRVAPPEEFSADLDQRVAEMRQMLAAMKPSSTASALQALRDTFPDVPLGERIRALSDARH